MTLLKKDFFGQLIQQDFTGLSTVLPVESLPLADQLEFSRVSNGSVIPHSKNILGDVVFEWDSPHLGSPPLINPKQLAKVLVDINKAY